MARRGKFGTGGSGSSVAGDVIRDINRMTETGDTTASAGTTDGTAKARYNTPSTASLIAAKRAATPDYSGLDFTGLDRAGIKSLKKTVETPEYVAARKAVGRAKKASMTPFTEREIATDAASRAISGGITYEKALANYRKYTNKMNKLPSEGSGPNKEFTLKEQARYRKVMASLSPEQRESRRILFLLGGLGRDSAVGGLTGETGTERFYRRMGMEAPYGRLGVEGAKNLPYAPLNEKTTKDGKTIIANPLSQQQRSKLQRLRSLGSLTSKQKQALANLRLKKNAPTPYTGE